MREEKKKWAQSKADQPNDWSLDGKIFELFYLVGLDNSGAPTTLVSYPNEVSKIIAQRADAVPVFAFPNGNPTREKLSLLES